MADTNDLLIQLKDILTDNKALAAKLTDSVDDLADAIKKMGSAPAAAPTGTAAHEAYVKELVDTIKKGLEEGLTPLVEGLGRGALGSGGGGGGEGGGGEGGGGGGYEGGHDYVGAKNEIRIASQITGTWEDLKDSFNKLLSARDNFADAREQQIELLQGQVATMQRQLVSYMSGKDLLESMGRQREESLELVKSGLGGMLDTMAHNFQGAVDGFGRHAQMFAGGAISFSQAVKLIQGTQGFYGRFDGDRTEFSRQMAESMDRVEIALRRNGGSIYDYQSGNEARQMIATLTDIYGLNVQQVENAENLRRLDTPGNISRAIAQLEFLRQTARNTGRSVEELQQMQPPEDLLEMMNKAGLDESQSMIMGQLNTMSELAQNPRFAQNLATALRGRATGMGIGAFSDDPEAISRGEAQAALDVVDQVQGGVTDLHQLITQYNGALNEGSNLNLVGMEMSIRANRRLQEQVDTWRDDQRRADQHPMLERLGNMFSDYFENQARGQFLAAGGSALLSLTSATHLNTLATWALNMTMGARGPFASMFRGLGERLGMLTNRLGPLGRLFGLGEGAATTAAAGSGGLMRMAGSLGGRVLGGVTGAVSGAIGFANGVDPMFQTAFQNQAAASAADAGSNWAKVLAGAATLFPPTAIFGVVYTAIDQILEAVFGAGISDAIGFLVGGIWDFFTTDFSWDKLLRGIGESLFNTVKFIFNPIGTMFDMLHRTTEEAARETEEHAEEASREAARNAGRVIQLGAGNMQSVVFPNGETQVIDLNAAVRGLRQTDDSQQGGMSDSQILQAIMQGGQLQAEMVRVLRSIDNQQRHIIRNDVTYDTDTTVNAGRR